MGTHWPRPPAWSSGPRRPGTAQTHPARCRRPTLLSRNCRLSAWSFFIRGRTVQPGFRPRFSTACGDSRAGPDHRPACARTRGPSPGARARARGPYLQQRVGGDLQHHGALRHVPQRLLEQHRAHQVVDVVLGGRRAGQAALPLGLRDGGAEPARGAGPRVPDHLRTGYRSAPVLRHFCPPGPRAACGVAGPPS